MKIMGQIKNACFGLVQIPNKDLAGGLHLEFDFGGDNKGTYQLIEDVCDDIGGDFEVDCRDSIHKCGMLFFRTMEILQKSKCGHVELLKGKFILADIEDNKIKAIQFDLNTENSRVLLN